MFALLGPVLSLLGIEAETITANLKRNAVLYGLLGGFGLVCVAFLLVAANSALTYVLGPVVAPLIIAAVAAVAAIIVMLVAYIQDGIAARREAERQRSAETTALVTTAIIAAIPALLKSPLMREIGLPAGAAIASALLLRRAVPPNDPEP